MSAMPALHPHLPDRSQVMLSYPLNLATRGAIQTYNRTFRRVDAALYLAQIIVRVQGAASRQFGPEIVQVNAALDDELRRLEDTLATQRGWLTHRRAAAAPAAETEAEAVIYTDPATATLTLRTPKARRYARLLTALDQALQRLDRAWYDDAIGDDERLDRIATLIRGFHRACGAIERLARGLAQRVRAEDDTAAPDATYQAMLIRRTGRGAGEAPPAPPEPDAEWPMMTATEAAGLEEMEQMAVDLAGAAEAAPASSLAGADPAAEEPPAAEDARESAPPTAARDEPNAETEAMSDSPTAPVEATLERPHAKTDALPPGVEVIAAMGETASEPASTQKTPPAPPSLARASKASRFDDLMSKRMTA